MALCHGEILLVFIHSSVPIKRESSTYGEVFVFVGSPEVQKCPLVAQENPLIQELPLHTTTLTTVAIVFDHFISLEPA
jgi:hypothetical protein